MEGTEQHTFEDLVRRHQAAVCAIAYSHLRDRARSEEVAQEAFLLAWLRRGDIPPSAGWVCGIARNLARNAARRPRENAMTNETASPGPDARDQLIDHEAQERAVAALATLPEKFRDAIVVYYRGDESMAEVAIALGITEAAAKKRVLRGRDKLRGALVSVERVLRGSRPSAAFTTAVVAAWALRGRDAAAAATSGAGAAATGGIAGGVAASSFGLAKGLVAAGAIGGVLVAGTVVAVATGVFDRSPDRSGARGAQPIVRSAHFDKMTRGPVTATRPTKAPAIVVTPRSHRSEMAVATGGSIDLDFKSAPFKIVAQLLGGHLGMMPIRVDRSLQSIYVDVQGKALDPLETLDDTLAAIHAVRDDTTFIRITNADGKSDATSLGGDLVTLQLTDVPIQEAVDAVEPALHMPINVMTELDDTGDARKALDDYAQRTPPHVTIDVHDEPAAVALQQILDQLHWHYDTVAGFLITPGASSAEAR